MRLLPGPQPLQRPPLRLLAARGYRLFAKMAGQWA